jgi:hypothetical protein
LDKEKTPNTCVDSSQVSSVCGDDDWAVRASLVPQVVRVAPLPGAKVCFESVLQLTVPLAASGNNC